jgi:hypothetical protein
MYDAYSYALGGASGPLPPYLPNISNAPRGTLPPVAVAGAAYQTLVGLYPSLVSHQNR